VDPRITSARRLLAEHHKPITMTQGELWKLLARFQRRTVELLEVIKQAGQPGAGEDRWAARP
jgi:hypothetical protein